jgi:hypothetical protein
MAFPPRESAPQPVLAPWLPPSAHVSCRQDEDMLVLAIHAGGEVVSLGLSPLMSNWSGPWMWLLCKAWGAHYRAQASVPYDLSEPAKGGE